MTSTTWTQNAGMDSGTDSDAVVTYAEAAQAAATAAAASETAADASETAAAASATSATTSKNAAAASASSAASSASNAATSATAAAGSATSAAASASLADSEAANADASATAAASSATSAASSASNAATSATNAGASEDAASTSATAAAASATAASSSASAADTHRLSAAASDTSAAAHEAAASTFANNSAASATTAAGHASDAYASEVAAAASEANAATSETNAATSATSAAGSASAASSSASNAAASATSAAASATSANNDKLAAQAAATSATNTAAALTGFDLEAIAASKAVTAVDVFVYDTSKDSDGGAWRKRTQHTSWYNETLNTATRGSRREFPAVAVIVAESNKVTIYDGDDPALPMWMVFNGASSVYRFTGYSTTTRPISSVFALNGSMVIGSTANGFATVTNFISDGGQFFGTGSPNGFLFPEISLRNTNLTNNFGQSNNIVNSTVNDVAMTVLPDAPIDPATGLPVPTIAVATAGGVSVIKDDGTVVDITNSNATYTFSDNISVNEYGAFTISLGADNSNRWVYVFDAIPPADTVINYNNKTASGLAPVSFYTDTTNFNADFRPVANTAFAANDTKALLGDKRGTTLGLARFLVDKTAPTSALHSFTTSIYNTGWMNGDIKGAFLSDTDDTDLVGSGELVTNGTFDTDVSGWSDATSSGTGSISWNSGAMQLNSDGTSNRARGSQSFSTTVGATYVLQYDATNFHHARVGTTENGSNNLSLLNQSSGSKVATFTASATTSWVTFEGFNAAGSEPNIDNVSVKLADADRSVNNKGLIVNGTVTRSPVATGAELVAYSGFSSSNYLEQPYNSALDFGTGDFCVMGWVNASNFNSVDAYVARSSVSTSGGGWIFGAASGALKFWETPTVGYVGRITGAALSLNTWSHVVLVRMAGVLYVYQNGQLTASAAFTSDISHNTPAVSLGLDSDFGSYAAGATKMALWRISATAPTAEQIKKIYEDEKVLFQENAACTLYGTSDAVTALDHDEDTGLLHVGTSAGRSVFQGLRRVSNTTTAVGTAISASGGLVVEE